MKWSWSLCLYDNICNLLSWLKSVCKPINLEVGGWWRHLNPIFLYLTSTFVSRQWNSLLTSSSLCPNPPKSQVLVTGVLGVCVFYPYKQCMHFAWDLGPNCYLLCDGRKCRESQASPGNMHGIIFYFIIQHVHTI